MIQKDDSQPPENRREFTRVPFHVKTRIATDKKTYVVDKMRDLSLGGCFLPASEPTVWGPQEDIDAGKPCTVTIELSGTTTGLKVDIAGTIVRVNEGGIAVEFTAITPENLYHLQNIIRYNAMDADRIDQEFREHLSRNRHGTGDLEEH